MKELYAILARNIERSLVGIFFCLLFSIIILSTGLIISHIENIPFSYLSRDTSAVLGGKMYAGVISNIGIVLWIASGFITLFAYSLLVRTKNTKFFKRYYLFSAIIVLMLGFDDLIMFHDRIFTQLIYHDEKYLFLFYGLVMISYSVVFYKILVSNKELPYFLIALIFFSLSIVVDIELIKVDKGLDLHYLLEDGFKFTGIVFWTVFLVKNSYRALSK